MAAAAAASRMDWDRDVPSRPRYRCYAEMSDSDYAGFMGELGVTVYQEGDSAPFKRQRTSMVRAGPESYPDDLYSQQRGDIDFKSGGLIWGPTLPPQGPSSVNPFPGDTIDGNALLPGNGIPRAINDSGLGSSVQFVDASGPPDNETTHHYALPRWQSGPEIMQTIARRPGLPCFITCPSHLQNGKDFSLTEIYSIPYANWMLCQKLEDLLDNQIARSVMDDVRVKFNMPEPNWPLDKDGKLNLGDKQKEEVILGMALAMNPWGMINAVLGEYPTGSPGRDISRIVVDLGGKKRPINIWNYTGRCTNTTARLWMTLRPVEIRTGLWRPQWLPHVLTHLDHGEFHPETLARYFFGIVHSHYANGPTGGSTSADDLFFEPDQHPRMMSLLSGLAWRHGDENRIFNPLRGQNLDRGGAKEGAYYNSLASQTLGDFSQQLTYYGDLTVNVMDAECYMEQHGEKTWKKFDYFVAMRTARLAAAPSSPGSSSTTLGGTTARAPPGTTWTELLKTGAGQPQQQQQQQPATGESLLGHGSAKYDEPVASTGGGPIAKPTGRGKAGKSSSRVS